MNLNEAIKARHSVRAYKEQPLAPELAEALEAKVKECNEKGSLHIQLVLNEPKAFQARLAKYGKFSGVTHYLIMAGRKSDTLDERVGYYGEQLVLLAQTLGLNTCWVGLTYSKVPAAYTLDEGEKVACCIAIGYGATQGVGHKIKSVEQVSNANADTPVWFRCGVEAALLAPTAVNQQKFHLDYIAPAEGGRAQVRAKRVFTLMPYAKMDLGIVKLHFEIGAGEEAAFDWAE